MRVLSKVDNIILNSNVNIYRKFEEGKDEDGPKAAEKRVGKVATEEREEEDSSNKVSDCVCRFGEGKVHLVDDIGYQIIPNCSYSHYLKSLKPCTSLYLSSSSLTILNISN